MVPPLNALQAFVAAATTTSFRDAAERLNVTPSAISHRIRLLEDLLDTPLFVRTTRQVTLTAAGEAYLPAVRDALERLEVATTRVMTRPRRQRLTISAAPSFAMNWLMPRIPRFQVAHPDIEVRLDPETGLVDLLASDVDVAIRHTAYPHRPGLTVHHLFDEPMIVVCAPRLAEPLRTVDDLATARLIQTISRHGQWDSWVQAAGGSFTPEVSLTVEFDSVAEEAAIDGLGVALIAEPFVRRSLSEGRLVAPFGYAHETREAYHLLYPQTREDDPAIVAFRDWLLAARRQP